MTIKISPDGRDILEWKERELITCNEPLMGDFQSAVVRFEPTLLFRLCQRQSPVTFLIEASTDIVPA